MNPVPRLRDYRGPVLLSYGFRPFFLLGAVYAGLTILAWLPMFNGELALSTAFGPIDWHVHEMLYGYLPAVVTGFLLTAIPNWTGRLPIQGMPLLTLVAVWLAGRVAVTFSAEIGWLPAAIIDVGFLILVVAATAREIVAGKNWRNLRVIAMVTLLLAGNIAFHLEAHFNGSAEYGARIGIAAIVLLLAVIGGRIIPSFTRNWLARENPGRLPAPFARFDVAVIGLSAATLALWTAQPVRQNNRGCTRRHWRTAYRALGPLGRGPDLARSVGADSARRLRLRAARLSARRRGGPRHGSGGHRDPCLDGRRGRHVDAGGDDARQPWPYRQRAQRFGGDAGDLCGGRHRRARAYLLVAGAGLERAVVARLGVRLGRGVFRLCRIVRTAARRCAAGQSGASVKRRLRRSGNLIDRHSVRDAA